MTRSVPLIAAGIGVPATAAARQLADLLGIDLAQVAPDQFEQRVTRDAVALHVRGLLAPSRARSRYHPAPAPAAALLPAMQEPTSVVRMTGVRGTIARRMHDSLAQMAQLTLFMDADLDAVVADRERRKADGAAPSYTDYIIAATARALREHPIVNSQITDDGVALLPHVHVGMAVALDNGLIVPVIRDTATLDLATLSVESTRLAEAARAGSLALDRPRRRHVLGEHARNVRRRRVHAGDQPAEHRDPRGRTTPRRRRARRRRPTRRRSSGSR